MELVKQKNAYKRDVFFAACSQVAPSSSPPEIVVVEYELYLVRLRDTDNAWASLKWAIDALRLPRKGESVHWRNGISERKGYLVDDDPAHIVEDTLEQFVSNKPRLVVTISPVVGRAG